MMEKSTEKNFLTKDIESTSKPGSNYLFSITFHVESLRLFAHSSFLFILVVAAVLTETLQDKLDSIPDPTETTIYNIFGFNHTCNWIDHNPAKLVAGILLPAFQLPYFLYIYFYHKRVQKSVENNEVPKWLLQYSSVITPFNLLAVSQIHIWLVHPPHDTYGFIAHYIPYFSIQTTFALQLILNVYYLTSKNNLPWGIPASHGKFYVYWLILLTLLSQGGVIVILSPATFFDTKNNMTQQIIFRAVSYLYSFCVWVLPIPISATLRKDGDLMNISLF